MGWTRTFSQSGMLAAAAWAACVGGAMAADVQRGSTIYSTHCTICHGADGTPVMPGAPNFRRMESLIRPDSQLLTAIRNGKGPMPAYYGVLRDREILDVVAYLRTLN